MVILGGVLFASFTVLRANDLATFELSPSMPTYLQVKERRRRSGGRIWQARDPVF